MFSLISLGLLILVCYGIGTFFGLLSTKSGNELWAIPAAVVSSAFVGAWWPWPIF